MTPSGEPILGLRIRSHDRWKAAAVTGDVQLLKQAVLHDPLTAAVCDPEEIWQMVDEMLVAQAPWLPQYRANGEIARAKQRFAACKRAGKYRGTHKSPGAARLKLKSVSQLRKSSTVNIFNAINVLDVLKIKKR